MTEKEMNVRVAVKRTELGDVTVKIAPHLQLSLSTVKRQAKDIHFSAEFKTYLKNFVQRNKRVANFYVFSQNIELGNLNSPVGAIA